METAHSKISDTDLIPIAHKPIEDYDPKRHGVPFRREISLWKVPTSHLPQYLPLNVPLDSTIERHTFGQNGKITAWFNNAFVRYRGRNWMNCRMECVPRWRHGRMAAVAMTDELAVIPDTHRWMPLPGMYGMAESQDARFLIHRDQLFMSFGDGKRMRMAVLDEDLRVQLHYMFTPDNFQLTPIEKNWVFFSHDSGLYGIYKTSPHVVIKATGNRVHEIYRNTDWMKDYGTTKGSTFHGYGEPRGGASPVFHNGMFYHFFHSSSLYDSGEQSRHWSERRRYHMGLTVFEADPPFKPLAYLRHPIMSAWEEHVIIPEPGHWTRQDHCAVFPGSAHRDGDAWVIAMGINDHHCGFARIPDTLIEPFLI